jgi:hypothetical protein
VVRQQIHTINISLFLINKLDRLRGYLENKEEVRNYLAKKAQESERIEATTI